MYDHMSNMCNRRDEAMFYPTVHQPELTCVCVSLCVCVCAGVHPPAAGGGAEAPGDPAAAAASRAGHASGERRLLLHLTHTLTSARV